MVSSNKSDGVSKAFAKKYDEFTNEYQGIFKIGACDCDDEVQICSKEKVTTFPTVRIYPPQPIPAFDYEGELSIPKLINQGNTFLQSNVAEINETNINTFIGENPSVPKVLLFTKKETGLPLMYKGLSLNFDV